MPSFFINDLTSQLHSLHQQEGTLSQQNRESGVNKATTATRTKKDQIFDGALRTLDASVREACRDATAATIAAVNAIQDRSCFDFVTMTTTTKKKKKGTKKSTATTLNSSHTSSTFRASTHHPLSDDVVVALDLADGRLVAACSATQHMAAAVAKTAATLKIRTEHFGYQQQRWPDRIDYLVDQRDQRGREGEDGDEDEGEILHRSLFGGVMKKVFGTSPSSCGPMDENASAIKHVAVAVQTLSQMANEARVVLALVKEEAERVRVQRMRFAKCGAIVNPMDQIADHDSSADAAHLVHEGSRLLSSRQRQEHQGQQQQQQQEEDQQGKTKTFLANLTTGTEDFLANTAVGKASNKIFEHVVKTAAESSSSVISSSTLISKGVSSLFNNLSSKTSSMENVLQGVARLATETTDKIVDRVIAAGSSSSSSSTLSLTANNRQAEKNGLESSTNDDEEENLRRKKNAAAAADAELKSLTSALRVDRRKLSELATKMQDEGKRFNWVQMAAESYSSSNNNSDNNNNDGTNANRTTVEDRLGLRLEHHGLETRMRDESAQAAKEVERSIQELGRMTTILQEQVSLQTEQLQVIEKNTDESTANVEKAQEELDKHDLDKFWSYKRVLAAIIWAHTIILIVLHYVIR